MHEEGHIILLREDGARCADAPDTNPRASTPDHCLKQKREVTMKVGVIAFVLLLAAVAARSREHLRNKNKASLGEPSCCR